MFEATQDIRIKLLVMNWLEKEEVVEILQSSTLPSITQNNEWLRMIVEDCYPLQKYELLYYFSIHDMNVTLVDYLKLCCQCASYSNQVLLS